MHRFFCSVLLSILAVDAGLADQPVCKLRPDLVGACFKVHGRLNYWNGTPSTRIWIIGSHHVLGVRGEDTMLPPNVKAHFRDFDDEVTADFEVCPLSKYRKGEMQSVCVQSATNVRHRRMNQ